MGQVHDQADPADPDLSPVGPGLYHALERTAIRKTLAPIHPTTPDHPPKLEKRTEKTILWTTGTAGRSDSVVCHARGRRQGKPETFERAQGGCTHVYREK